MAVDVPREVYEGLLAIRDSELTNMLDAVLVEDLAATSGYQQAALWIQRNHARYIEGVLEGFTPVED